MRMTYKLFDFMGSAVNLRLWFFLLLLFLPIFDFISIFIAVLVHELSHAFVAKRLNYRVGSLTIDLFYGSAEVESVANHKDNILICLAGPLSNLILYIVSYLLNMVLPSTFMTSMMNINLVLFIFNILPIYPLDGGRITKSILSKIFGNKSGSYYNGMLSLLFSVLMFLFAINCGFIILAIFSLLFSYMSFKEIETHK